MMSEINQIAFYNLLRIDMIITAVQPWALSIPLFLQKLPGLKHQLLVTNPPTRLSNYGLYSVAQSPICLTRIPRWCGICRCLIRLAATNENATVWKGPLSSSCVSLLFPPHVSL
ncbi:acetyl-CoA carboxylase 1, partial [Striga asiatica]